MASGAVPRKESALAVSARQPVEGITLFFDQLGGLLWKDYVVRSRAWKSNVLLVAQAAIFILLTWGVDKAVQMSNQRRPTFSSIQNPTPQQITPIPDCSENMFMRKDEHCYTLLYAPMNVEVVDAIVRAVARRNVPPIPEYHIRGFANGSLIDEYLLAHPNTVIAAVEFAVDNPQHIGFSVQTNTSVQWFKGNFQDPNLYAALPVQAAVHREIARHIMGGDSLRWAVDITEFPHPSTKSPSAIAEFAPTFLFASLMFQFVLQLHDILHERESGARRIMSTMGLRYVPFWTSWIVYQGTLAILEAGLLVGFSYAFKFNLFVLNDFALSFLLILEVSLAMCSFGFFVAAFLRKAGSAVPVGFFVFVVAWVFLVVQGFGFPYSPKYSPITQAVFSLFPWTLLGKGIDDLANATEGLNSGLRWKDRTTYCQVNTPSPSIQQSLSYWQANCVMPLGTIYVILSAQIVVYFALALYLDNVLPDEYGSSRPVWYILQPRYWFPRQRLDTSRAKASLARFEDTEPPGDIDVREERDRMKERCRTYVKQSEEGGIPGPAVVAEENQQLNAVEMYGLKKSYRRGFFRKRAFTAVYDNWLGIREGECFCLLGPNGAGKTTTIHCLTGVLPLTEGDAIVSGKSIASVGGLDSIRPLMGVCPQFDTSLCALLTGKEHLQLFARIKGVPPSLRSQEVNQLLEEVKLLEAADVTAGAYSGGMRRRLSVALALLGDPKIVYLDEPTTGLDPISRRHLWDLIDKAKHQRAVVLTTHSMEEADILGDRIGIMVRGKLRCVGSSLRLKSRFGSGYRVSVRIQAGDNNGMMSETVSNLAAQSEVYKDRIRELFMHRLGVKPGDESLDYLHFLVPYESEDKLPLMLAHIKKQALDLHIADVQLRLTPLEEVFLNVTKRAELEHAEAEGRYESLVLAEESLAVRVPIGAEFIQSPSGQFYHIKWIQDDNGELKIQDYWKDELSINKLQKE